MAVPNPSILACVCLFARVRERMPCTCVCLFVCLFFSPTRSMPCSQCIASHPFFHPSNSTYPPNHTSMHRSHLIAWPGLAWPGLALSGPRRHAMAVHGEPHGEGALVRVLPHGLRARRGTYHSLGLYNCGVPSKGAGTMRCCLVACYIYTSILVCVCARVCARVGGGVWFCRSCCLLIFIHNAF